MRCPLAIFVVRSPGAGVGPCYVVACESRVGDSWRARRTGPGRGERTWHVNFDEQDGQAMYGVQIRWTVWDWDARCMIVVLSKQIENTLHKQRSTVYQDVRPPAQMSPSSKCSHTNPGSLLYNLHGMSRMSSSAPMPYTAPELRQSDIAYLAVWNPRSNQRSDHRCRSEFKQGSRAAAGDARPHAGECRGPCRTRTAHSSRQSRRAPRSRTIGERGKRGQRAARRRRSQGYRISVRSRGR